MDKIILSDCHFLACIGVTTAERGAPQPISIDLELNFDTRLAGQSDSLSDTINYSAIHSTLQAYITSHSFQLIEALAEHLATEVIASFPIKQLTLRLKKPGALNKKGGAYAAVEITRP